MTVYEIDEALESLVDENGEIEDLHKFELLSMERERKIEGMALWAKNLSYEAQAIDQEIQSLQARKATAERKAKRLKSYLEYILRGENFATGKVAIGYRKSEHIEIENAQNLAYWLEQNGMYNAVKYKPPEISKTALKMAVKAGEEIPGVRLVEERKLRIK